jgi:ABC-2 type transport system permease protein
MRYSTLIAKKEYKGYFNSPTAYIVLTVFLLMAGWFFSSPLFLNNSSDLRSLFSIIPIVYLFFVPAITMGLISREKHSGTLETLTTLPIQDNEIVMGKFMASVGLVATGLLFTLVHLVTIVLLGTNIDYGAIFCGYLGLLLLGAVYSSIGIFTSSLTNNQIISFIISFLIVAFFFILDFTLQLLPSGLVGVFQYLSTGYHLSNISRGVIDTRNIVYFLSLTALFLKLATIVMESRKWK